MNPRLFNALLVSVELILYCFWQQTVDQINNIMVLLVNFRKLRNLYKVLGRRLANFLFKEIS